jgi:4-amino-4-deoxy-L-arabinose transferase-like glycosyltransferase
MMETAQTRRERRQLWLFLLIATIVLGAGIGLRDPWPADEPRFVLVAKHMVESGDWLITRRGSELYSDKPPTFMILQAAAYQAVGNWRIAFLLPSLLAALGTLFLVCDLGRRLWNPRVGLWAGIAVLATLQFAYQSKRAQIDPLETFVITLANYGLLRHLLLGPDWRAYWLGCFAAGLGVITKGVGVLALLMLVPFVYARWRRWPQLTQTDRDAWRWLGGAAAFLAALALWLVPMILAVHANGTAEYHAYLEDILFRQTADRYSGSWSHQQPPWYFLEVILFSWLPLTFVLIAAVPAWIERLRARDARFLLPLVWVVLVLLFFSIPSGKRDVYILPALPMAALVCAPFLDAIIQRRAMRWVLFGFLALLGLAFFGVGIAAWAQWLPHADHLAIERGLGEDHVGLWVFLSAVGMIALASAIVFRLRRSHIGLGVALGSLWTLWGLWAYPILNDSVSAADVMRRAGAIAGVHGEIALVGWSEQNLLQADRKVTEFGYRTPVHEQLADAIRWQEADPERRWIFVLDDALGACVDLAGTVNVGHANRRQWLMFRADAVSPACRGGQVPPIGTESTPQ